MLSDKDCSIILTLAGSTSAGGCMQVYADMIRYNIWWMQSLLQEQSIVDMDFFEALGFNHYKGTPQC
jgi:deoxyhypusine synthase